MNHFFHYSGSDDSPWGGIHDQLDQQLLQGAEACVKQGVLEQVVLDRLRASGKPFEFI